MEDNHIGRADNQLPERFLLLDLCLLSPNNILAEQKLNFTELFACVALEDADIKRLMLVNEA